MKEFPELQEKYDDIAIIVGNYEQWDEVQPIINRFSIPSSQLGKVANTGPPTGPSVPPTGPLGNSDTCQEERKGYTWIVFNNFSKATKREQEDTIRHEFCHLTLEHDMNRTMGELCLKYPKRPYDILKVVDTFFRQYLDHQAELCCLKRFPSYYQHYNQPPHKYVYMRPYYLKFRKQHGKTEAFAQGILNFLIFLHHIKRNEYIINEIKPDTVNWFRETNQLFRQQQKVIIKCMKKDFQINIKKYLNEKLFDEEEGFLSKMMTILELIDYNAMARGYVDLALEAIG